MVFLATALAARAHDGQYRKGIRIPYLVHPLKVAAILAHAGLDEPVVAAAILHDTVEDTDVTMADLRADFPAVVCDLVHAVTEMDKTASWEDRKTQAIGRIATHPPEALCLSCADKIDNIESLEEELSARGEATWDLFSRGRERQEWFFTSILAALRRADAALIPPGDSDAGAPNSFVVASDALPRLLDRFAGAVARVFPNAV